MKAPQKETAKRQNAEWKQLSRYLDVSWSYLLAKHMEQFKTNDTLGYRTAGSKAEFLTGELLAEEMRSIGVIQAGIRRGSSVRFGGIPSQTRKVFNAPPPNTAFFGPVTEDNVASAEHTGIAVGVVQGVGIA